MADQEHLDILKKGVKEWNKWREEHPEIRPDLIGIQFPWEDLSGVNFSETDLTEAYLYETNFNGANLSGANLSRSHLYKANFVNAELQDAILSQAELVKADFIQADLNGAILKEAQLNWADFSTANLMEVDLSGANLSWANLSEARLNSANLTGCLIYAISAWNIDLENAIQSNLVITPDNEPEITVDNLEVAQFIYLILKHEKLRGVLNSVMERGVLLLGRFSNGGHEILQSIAAKLREMKYLPMIFDFDRPEGRNYTETVKTLVGLSRFVIVDLSGPSVPQELYATIPHFKIPFVPIIEKGRNIYAMFSDLAEYPWVLNPVEFISKEQLLELLPARVIEPAEERFRERQTLLNQLFNR